MTAAVSFTAESPLEFGAAVTRCREALAREGFGVLCEIDVQATLKAKLGVDREPLLILGACHPPSAHRALEAVPDVSVLLPCNVAVAVEGGRTVVRAMNPESALGMLDSDAIRRVAGEVGAALRRVVAAATA